LSPVGLGPPKSCRDTVAIRTADLTLRDLTFDSDPGSASVDHRRDLYRLVVKVIELEYYDVGFAAVDARVTA
jgi:hypothetical protein